MYSSSAEQELRGKELGPPGQQRLVSSASLLVEHTKNGGQALLLLLISTIYFNDHYSFIRLEWDERCFFKTLAIKKSNPTLDNFGDFNWG